ncbi:MAG: hypothetical protein U5L96_08435 [Owenweeksia sp.]|nr:hypothetical protein [Owenweeksia sp.]
MSEHSLWEAGEIDFSYAPQKSFPPEKAKRNFDLEAMVYANDSLFLFTKNRTQPFSGYTYLYAMPAKPGTYQLSPIDSISLGEGLRELYWVGGAAFEPC